jgi:hypothetical protein
MTRDRNDPPPFKKLGIFQGARLYANVLKRKTLIKNLKLINNDRSLLTPSLERKTRKGKQGGSCI